MTIHSLKRSFAPRNIENQIRNLDPFQATNWNDACLKDRPTTDSFFFTRRVDPAQKSLSFVSQSVLHAEKVALATVSFSLAIFQRKSPRDPPPSHLQAAKFLIIFSSRSEIGRFSRTSILRASFTRPTMQMKLFLARPFDFPFQFLHCPS